MGSSITEGCLSLMEDSLNTIDGAMSDAQDAGTDFDALAALGLTITVQDALTGGGVATDVVSKNSEMVTKATSMIGR